MSLKLSLLSIKVPKYLKFDSTSTDSLFTLAGTNTFLVFLAFSTNSFVLPTFISKKLYSHHSFKSETCEKYVARESSFNSSPTSAMSSANLKRQVTAVCKFIWLVFIENNIGGRTHPWGAPEFSTTSSDRCPFTQTRCGRSRRKSLIHSTRCELTCKSISLFSSTYGSIALNAPEKSTNKILTYDLAFCKCCVIKFRRVREASSTPLEAFYANWNGSSWSTTSNFKCLDTAFSKHFAMMGVRDFLPLTAWFQMPPVSLSVSLCA